MKEYVGVLIQLLVLGDIAGYGAVGCAVTDSDVQQFLCPAHFIPFGLDDASGPPQNDSKDSTPVTVSAFSQPEIAYFGSFSQDFAWERTNWKGNGQDELMGNGLLRAREAEELSTLAWEVEISWCVLVILALWLGFCLGAGKRSYSPQTSKGLRICTQASTAAGSPETMQEEVVSESLKPHFNGYSQDSCPMPDLPSLELESCDLPASPAPLHLENGRLHSSFRDIKELYRDCRYRYYTATHILEGQRYILKEIIVPLTSLGNSQVLADFQIKSKCGSKYVLRYVTCWAEESSPSRVKILIQIEYFSLTSLSELLSSDTSLSRKDVCRVYRQIVKGVNHLHEEGLACFPLTAASIYLDENRNVKIADFELCRGRKSCRSLTVDGLEGFTDSIQCRRRQIRSLGLLLYQLVARDEDGLADLMENNALEEYFLREYPLEAEIILGLIRKGAVWPETADLLKSALFREWSEAAGVHSPTLPPKVTMGGLPLLSLIKVP